MLEFVVALNAVVTLYLLVRVVRQGDSMSRLATSHHATLKMAQEFGSQVHRQAETLTEAIRLYKGSSDG